MSPKWKKGGHCGFCETDETDVTKIEQTGVNFNPSTGKSESADCCRICYELGAYYLKNKTDLLRFDQFSRGLRMLHEILRTVDP